MGIKTRLIKYKEVRSAKSKEAKAFKDLVAKRTLQARRQTFEEESIAQAKIKGKEMAKDRAKPLGKTAVSFVKGFQSLSRPRVAVKRKGGGKPLTIKDFI